MNKTQLPDEQRKEDLLEMIDHKGHIIKSQYINFMKQWCELQPRISDFSDKMKQLELLNVNSIEFIDRLVEVHSDIAWDLQTLTLGRSGYVHVKTGETGPTLVGFRDLDRTASQHLGHSIHDYLHCKDKLNAMNIEAA